MKSCWCGNEDFLDYSEGYHYCEVCKTLISKCDIGDSVYSVKDEDEDLYGKNYWEQQMLGLSGAKNLDELIDLYLKERTVYWLKCFLKYILPGSSVAEIGCGLGQFSYLLKKTGYSENAFELSPEISEYINKTLNINVTSKAFESINESYDAIIAFDVFEHIIKPYDFLKNIGARLTENGFLCFQMPCFDDKLSYSHMLENKPDFKEHLKSKEHVYIYSRESIVKILKESGFSYYKFEDAFFGNDYDMFIFASKQPLRIFTEKEIEEALNKQQNGRLIKALISVFEENLALRKKLKFIENESNKRIDQIETLTHRLSESEKDREARLEVINILTGQLNESEEDRAARLESINTLTAMIDELNVKTEY